jgi:hypothetical protein
MRSIEIPTKQSPLHKEFASGSVSIRAGRFDCAYGSAQREVILKPFLHSPVKQSKKVNSPIL